MPTNPECKNASCPEGKARNRLTDGGGLYLEVALNGSKRWFWKYLFDPLITSRRHAAKSRR